MLNILMDIRTYFSIQRLLLKGIYLDCLKIFDLFWDIKMENGVLGETQKNTRHKMGTHFKTQL